MGRPPKDDPRSTVLSIRVNAAELAKLTEAASRAGKSLTTYIRDRALRR